MKTISMSETVIIANRMPVGYFISLGGVALIDASLTIGVDLELCGVSGGFTVGS